MERASPRPKLPGSLHRRGSRWWWKVQLPNEAKTKDRALKPPGSRRATTNRDEADKIALDLWLAGVRDEAKAQAQARAVKRIAELKAQFVEKVNTFSTILDEAEAKARNEAQARADAEARLAQLVQDAPTGLTCECCGRPDLPAQGVRRIDSGQWLCPTCLEHLLEDARRCASSGSRSLASER